MNARWPLIALRRIAEVFAVLWGAATLSFLALALIPGDPVDALLGPNVGASPALGETVRTDLGLGEPILVRYVMFLGRIATLDFGRSYRLGRDVTDLIGERISSTAQLALGAFAVAIALALTLAMVSSIGGRMIRSVVGTVELIGSSAPSFWIGILAITVFSFGLGWFPSTGSAGFSALVLPSITLAIPIGCILSRVLREGIDHARAQPFDATIRARGVSRSGVVIKHGLRHATIPTLTLSGWALAGFLGGAVLIETVFARSGLGRLLVDAITTRDIPVVTAVVMLSALAFVLVNMLVDLLSLVVDPRLRTGIRS